MLLPLLFHSLGERMIHLESVNLRNVFAVISSRIAKAVRFKCYENPDTFLPSLEMTHTHSFPSFF